MRGGYVFQGVRRCFPGAIDTEFGHRNSYVFLTESLIPGDPVNRGVRTSFPRTRLSTSSTSLFPRPAQLRCASPSRSATAHSRCPRSFGPEASFTEWLGRFNHWIWVEITCPAFLGVPLCPTLWHWLVHINTGPRNSQGRPSHSGCQAIHARKFFSLSKGEERARIPAEFRARIFEPLGSSGALREGLKTTSGGRLASSAGV